MQQNPTPDRRASALLTRRHSAATDTRSGSPQLPLPLADLVGDARCGEIRRASRAAGAAQVSARHVERLVRRERKRLASEIHDGLGQYLTGAALLAAAVDARIRYGETVTTDELKELRNAIDRAQRHCRWLAHREYSDEIRGGALGLALEALAGDQPPSCGITCRYRGPTKPLPNIADAVGHQLYRIAQEAVRNAIRHSGGTRVSIELAVDGQAITLSIADDGRGLGDRAQVRPRGIGIRTMFDRALRIGAAIAIEHERPSGTRVCVRVPHAAGR